MDMSRAVGNENFDKMKSYVSDVVSKLDVDAGNTRVGVLTYSNKQRTIVHLNEHETAAALQTTIDSLPYEEHRKANTHTALRYVRRKMLIEKEGDRPYVPNVVVVLTGGQSTLQTKVQVGSTVVH